MHPYWHILVSWLAVYSPTPEFCPAGFPCLRLLPFRSPSHHPMCAVSPHLRFASPACRTCCWDIHSFDVLDRSTLRLSATMASADFSQFVVTTANETACETSRDKSRTFPRLPARFTPLGYGCLLDFTVSSPLIRQRRLVIGFLFVGPRFRYGFFPPCTSRRKACQSLSGSSATTPLGTSTQASGHARHTRKQRPITQALYMNVLISWRARQA
jgi:hypothetical protein